MAGRRFGLGELLALLRGHADVLRDHVVAAHGARQATAPVGLEVKDLAGLFHHPVEKPLLLVAFEERPARLPAFRARHYSTPSTTRMSRSAPLASAFNAA